LRKSLALARQFWPPRNRGPLLACGRQRAEAFMLDCDQRARSGPGATGRAVTHPLQAPQRSTVAQREPVNDRGLLSGSIARVGFRPLFGLVVRTDGEAYRPADRTSRLARDRHAPRRLQHPPAITLTNSSRHSLTAPPVGRRIMQPL